MNEPDSDWQGRCGLGGAWGFFGVDGGGVHVTLEGPGLSFALAACTPGPDFFMFEFLSSPSLGQGGGALCLTWEPQPEGRNTMDRENWAPSPEDWGG